MLAVTEVLVFIFGGAMAWYGTALAVETWSAAMPGLPIPQGFDYVPLAVGGVLIALFSLEKLVRLLLVGDDAPMVRVDEPHLVAVKD
jgi:TRAP-type C4-dicarboxylate transport system permease small subunit